MGDDCEDIDDCGVCGGDGSSCSEKPRQRGDGPGLDDDCKDIDDCGVCGGDGSSCRINPRQRDGDGPALDDDSSCVPVNHVNDVPGELTCDCVESDDPCLLDGECVPEERCKDINVTDDCEDIDDCGVCGGDGSSCSENPRQEREGEVLHDETEGDSGRGDGEIEGDSGRGDGEIEYFFDSFSRDSEI